MLSSVQKITTTLMVAASVASVSSLAMAVPMGNGAAIRSATPATLESVHWRGWWGAPAAGFVAGAMVGGALAAPYYYGPYYPGPYYTAPYAYDGGGDAAYCAQRFKSYDPASGTYLGYDGHRHPCP